MGLYHCPMRVYACLFIKNMSDIEQVSSKLENMNFDNSLSQTCRNPECTRRTKMPEGGTTTRARIHYFVTIKIEFLFYLARLE